MGPYRLVRELGRGGMGTVWLADHCHLDEHRVALKLIKAGMDSDEVLQRFDREQRVLADLDHPGIVRLLEAGKTESGRPYLALEWVQGTSLITACRKLELTQALELFCELCEAVACAHEFGIVHRDLKPSNVMVTPEGAPKVLDFGLAKVLASEEEGSGALTLTGQQRLTPRYAAPEQVLGQDCSPATDVYALGTVLYELLSERPLHSPDATLRELESCILHEVPQWPSQVSSRERRSRLRGNLDVITLRALSKDPLRRYLDARALRADLQRHLRGEAIVARPDGKLYQLRKFASRHRTAVASVAAVVISLSAALAWALSSSVESAHQRSLAVQQTEQARWEAYSGLVQNKLQSLALLGSPTLQDAPSASLLGWEWEHLRARVDITERTLLTGASNQYLSLSPDGRLLAVQTSKSLELVDTLSGETQQSLPGDYSRAVLSADNQSLAFARENTVHVHSLVSEERWSWNLDSKVQRIRFVPQRSLLAVSCQREIVLLSLEQPDQQRQLANWKSEDLHASSTHILAGDREGRMHHLAIDDNLDRRVLLQLPEKGIFLSRLASSTDGRYVAGASKNGVAMVYDLQQERVVAPPLRTGQYCLAIAFRGDTPQLLLAGLVVHAWDFQSGRLNALTGALNITIESLVASSKGPQVYGRTRDGRILEWDARVPAIPRHRPSPEPASHLRIDPNGDRYVAYLWNESRLVLQDTRLGSTLAEWLADADTSPQDAFHDLVYGPDQQIFVATQKELLVLHSQNLSETAHYPLEGITCLALEPTSQSLLAGTNDGRLLQIGLDGALLQEHSTPLQNIRDLAIHSSGQRVWLLDQDRSTLVELDRKRNSWSHYPKLNHARQISISPDSQHLALACEDHVAILSSSDPSWIHCMPVNGCRTVRFTRDGKRLILASYALLRFVDTSNWKELCNLQTNHRGIVDLAMSKDDELLISSDWSGEICLLRAKPLAPN